MGWAPGGASPPAWVSGVGAARSRSHNHLRSQLARSQPATYPHSPALDSVPARGCSLPSPWQRLPLHQPSNVKPKKYPRGGRHASDVKNTKLKEAARSSEGARQQQQGAWGTGRAVTSCPVEGLGAADGHDLGEPFQSSDVATAAVAAALKSPWPIISGNSSGKVAVHASGDKAVAVKSRLWSSKRSDSLTSRLVKPQPLPVSGSPSTGLGACSELKARSAEEVSAALSREFGHSLVDGHCEASATSDEVDYSRIIPRLGAGPTLRQGTGPEIDEYLMRLLRVGASDCKEAHGLYPQTQPPQKEGPDSSDDSSGIGNGSPHQQLQRAKPQGRSVADGPQEHRPSAERVYETTATAAAEAAADDDDNLGRPSHERQQFAQQSNCHYGGGGSSVSRHIAVAKGSLHDSQHTKMNSLSRKSAHVDLFGQTGNSAAAQLSRPSCFRAGDEDSDYVPMKGASSGDRPTGSEWEGNQPSRTTSLTNSGEGAVDGSPAADRAADICGHGSERRPARGQLQYAAMFDDAMPTSRPRLSQGLPHDATLLKRLPPQFQSSSAVSQGVARDGATLEHNSHVANQLPAVKLMLDSMCAVPASLVTPSLCNTTDSMQTAMVKGGEIGAATLHTSAPSQPAHDPGVPLQPAPAWTQTQLRLQKWSEAQGSMLTQQHWDLYRASERRQEMMGQTLPEAATFQSPVQSVDNASTQLHGPHPGAFATSQMLPWFANTIPGISTISDIPMAAPPTFAFTFPPGALASPAPSNMPNYFIGGSCTAAAASPAGEALLCEPFLAAPATNGMTPLPAQATCGQLLRQTSAPTAFAFPQPLLQQPLEQPQQQQHTTSPASYAFSQPQLPQGFASGVAVPCPELVPPPGVPPLGYFGSIWPGMASFGGLTTLPFIPAPSMAHMAAPRGCPGAPKTGPAASHWFAHMQLPATSFVRPSPCPLGSVGAAPRVGPIDCKGSPLQLQESWKTQTCQSIDRSTNLVRSGRVGGLANGKHPLEQPHGHGISSNDPLSKRRKL